MKVVFSAEARNDLREIARFISQDDPLRALSFVRELRQKAKQIAERPLAFAFMPGHQSSGIRRRIHGRYLILFRVEGEKIEIVHIAHAARDVEQLLFPSA